MKNQLKSITIQGKKKRTAEEQSNGYAKAKKAFDAVMDAYASVPPPEKFSRIATDADRTASRLRIAEELAVSIPFYNEAPKKNGKKRGQGVVSAKGTPAKNATAPSFTDFRCDCEKFVWAVVRNHQHRAEFILRYVLGEERLTKEQQHLFAKYEQQIGRLFLRHKIYPLNLYFISVRQPLRHSAVTLKEVA